MDSIKNIIHVFQQSACVSSFISSMGAVHKQVANRLFLVPHDAAFKAISVMMRNTDDSEEKNRHDIQWVGATLNDEVPVKTLMSVLGGSFELKRNAFDDETVLIFQQVHGVQLHCVLTGVVHDDALEQEVFTRLKLIHTG